MSFSTVIDEEFSVRHFLPCTHVRMLTHQNVVKISFLDPIGCALPCFLATSIVQGSHNVTEASRSQRYVQWIPELACCKIPNGEGIPAC